MGLKYNICTFLLYATFIASTRAYGVREEIWFEVLKPKNVSYVYKLAPAKDFGAIFQHPFINVKMVPTEPDHGCSKLLENGKALHGNVALILRGGCSFLTKVINAELYGAIAAIIANNDDDIKGWVSMIGDGTGRNEQIGIPSFFLLGKDGRKIWKAIEENEDQYAIINLPVNISGTIPRNQPPWDYW